MKNFKRICAIMICSIYTTMSAQYSKENKNVIGDFSIMDARDNGEDLTSEMIKDNGKLVFYKTEYDNQIMLSNFWEISQSQSYGSIFCITKEETPESSENYKRIDYTFNWNYANSYDDVKGVAECKLRLLYKPQGIYFRLDILPKNLEPLIYRGELKGELTEIDSFIEK